MAPWSRKRRARTEPPAGPEPANRQEVDRKEDETDPREDRGRDERAVNERYDSGTFWRASARYGEFG